MVMSVYEQTREDSPLRKLFVDNTTHSCDLPDYFKPGGSHYTEHLPESVRDVAVNNFEHYNATGRSAVSVKDKWEYIDTCQYHMHKQNKAKP